MTISLIPDVFQGIPLTYNPYTASSFDCTQVDPSMASLCGYVTGAFPLVTLSCPNTGQYFVFQTGSSTSGTCQTYSDPVSAATVYLNAPYNTLNNYLVTGNQAWMLGASALVMIMTPGVGLFYAGLAGQETASNTIMMSFVTMCLITVQWFLFGYSFAFGPGTPGWGSFQWGAFTTFETNAANGPYGAGITNTIYAAFQCMFAQITPALISGAVIGRMKFHVWIVFVFLWGSLIYDGLAHWLWGWYLNSSYGAAPFGWAANLGSLDFAGGTVIHVSSGFAALAAAIVVGKRKTDKPLKAHNAPMTVIGATLLWFGWFGFNAGSAAMAGPLPIWTGATNTYNWTFASQALWNTHLATATASLSWLLTERIVDKTLTATGASAGAVAGLVAITPGCGYVNSWAACIFGIIVSPVCILGAKIKAKYGPDDTLDSFAVHGVGGAVGAFLTGLFANPYLGNSGPPGAFYGYPIRIGYQLTAITVAASYSFFGTLFLLYALKYIFGGLRVSDEAEAMGIDVSEHGNNFQNGNIVAQQELKASA
jgi:Amt family ammonium transporter